MRKKIKDLDDYDVIPFEDSLRNDIWDGIETGNEELLRTAILDAMNLFLSGKTDQESLESIAVQYLTAQIHLEMKKDFVFKDKKLAYVFQKVSALTEISEKRAIEVVKRFILYLKGKDYEKI